MGKRSSIRQGTRSWKTASHSRKEQPEGRGRQVNSRFLPHEHTLQHTHATGKVFPFFFFFFFFSFSSSSIRELVVTTLPFFFLLSSERRASLILDTYLPIILSNIFRSKKLRQVSSQVMSSRSLSSTRERCPRAVVVPVLFCLGVVSRPTN